LPRQRLPERGPTHESAPGDVHLRAAVAGEIVRNFRSRQRETLVPLLLVAQAEIDGDCIGDVPRILREHRAEELVRAAGPFTNDLAARLQPMAAQEREDAADSRVALDPIGAGAGVVERGACFEQQSGSSAEIALRGIVAAALVAAGIAETGQVQDVVA